MKWDYKNKCFIPQDDQSQHGFIATYIFGCRCKKCFTAMAKYQKEYRQTPEHKERKRLWTQKYRAEGRDRYENQRRNILEKNRKRKLKIAGQKRIAFKVK